ncbi:unnamed protein product [Amoebophrya sp. A25]|nr:unnamed protein product [Amoebophrya sp. A25]|eukprot:GSA25T00005615001.1
MTDEIVFSPTRSPRLRFGGGIAGLTALGDRMNKTLAELKEGRFDAVKGHEGVQSLQSKLIRLQDHFDDNIAEVQQSIVEHAAFYATSPQVLGGMIKLTEVLGLASVLLAQKAEAIQELLDADLAPLEQQFQQTRDRWEQLEEEVGHYRTQVSTALERGNKYETEVTQHLKNAKEIMRKKLVEEVDRKVADVTSRNRELQRQVKQLEFQLKRHQTAKAMGSSTVITKAHGSGPPDSAALRGIEMVDKVNELESLLDTEKGQMLTPMIKDACNYLRTLLAMKDDDAGGKSAASSASNAKARATSSKGQAPLFYSDGELSPERAGITQLLDDSSIRPPPVMLRPGGGVSTKSSSVSHNPTNVIMQHYYNGAGGSSSSSKMIDPQPDDLRHPEQGYSEQQHSGYGSGPGGHSFSSQFESQHHSAQLGSPAGSSVYSQSLRVGAPSGDYHRALGVDRYAQAASEEESVFSAPRLG